MKFLKKGQKIRALVDNPPPSLGNARKKTFFSIDVFPKKTMRPQNLPLYTWDWTLLEGTWTPQKRTEPATFFLFFSLFLNSTWSQVSLSQPNSLPHCLYQQLCAASPWRKAAEKGGSGGGGGGGDFSCSENTEVFQFTLTVPDLDQPSLKGRTTVKASWLCCFSHLVLIKCFSCAVQSSRGARGYS